MSTTDAGSLSALSALVLAAAWLAILGLGSLVTRLSGRGSVGATLIWIYVLASIGTTAPVMLNIIWGAGHSTWTIGRATEYYGSVLALALFYWLVWPLIWIAQVCCVQLDPMMAAVSLYVRWIGPGCGVLLVIMLTT